MAVILLRPVRVSSVLTPSIAKTALLWRKKKPSGLWQRRQDFPPRVRSTERRFHQLAFRMAAAQPAAAQDARAWDAEDVLPERPLYLLISALGVKETTAGNPASQAIFSEFGRTLESHGFYSEEDLTAPTVYRPTVEAIMDEVTGLDHGLRALFRRALEPGDSLDGGFEWPDAPQQHEAVQRGSGRKKPPAPTWSTAAQYSQMSLPPGAELPSLISMGIFAGIKCPATLGTKLADKDFKEINDRIFSAAQDNPQLQGGGLTERAKSAWEKELHAFCPPSYMATYGLKLPRVRVWNLTEYFSSRRSKT